MKGERVARLELLLRSHPEGLTRAEIARRLGVNRSTVSRYVNRPGFHTEIYEENNLIKLRNPGNSSPLELSVYESLAFNMSAEALFKSSKFVDPHLASGLRKLATNMMSYAPKVSANILSVADQMDRSVRGNFSGESEMILEVLIDCWVSGKIARITTNLPERNETDIAPYFIGFKDEGSERNPITVTGRLRHTKDIVTINIQSITDAKMLDETYTIPDNLKPFITETARNTSDAVDMIHLTLEVKELSALNSFSELTHVITKFEKTDSGYVCTMDAENSTDFFLRILQCGTSIKVLAPENYRKKLTNSLESILSLYKE